MERFGEIIRVIAFTQDNFITGAPIHLVTADLTFLEIILILDNDIITLIDWRRQCLMDLG